MKRVVQFGAGNIGRGFLGQLYSQSGWEIVYVDVVPEVIEALNRDHGFDIHVVGPGACSTRVENARAVDGRDLDAVADAIDSADLLGTAVGVNALPFIVPALAAGLRRRAARGAGIDMIICENLLDAAAFMYTKLADELEREHHRFLFRQLGLVETVVGRMIPVITPEQRAAEPLSVWVEAYDILPVNANGFRNGDPRIEGFFPTLHIHAFEERKLFCHNCMHCLASYFGYEAGMTYVWEAMTDAAIRARVYEGGWEAGRALVKKHRFSRVDYEEHIQDLLYRFSNQALGDTVARCGGDPVRKLGRRDRLVGSALAALAGGITPDVLVNGILSALAFDAPGDKSVPQVKEALARGGVDAVLTDICDLTSDEPLYGLVQERAVSSIG